MEERLGWIGRVGINLEEVFQYRRTRFHLCRFDFWTIGNCWHHWQRYWVFPNKIHPVHIVVVHIGQHILSLHYKRYLLHNIADWWLVKLQDTLQNSNRIYCLYWNRGGWVQQNPSSQRSALNEQQLPLKQYFPDAQSEFSMHPATHRAVFFTFYKITPQRTFVVFLVQVNKIQDEEYKDKYREPLIKKKVRFWKVCPNMRKYHIHKRPRKLRLIKDRIRDVHK